MEHDQHAWTNFLLDESSIQISECRQEKPLPPTWSRILLAPSNRTATSRSGQVNVPEFVVLSNAITQTLSAKTVHILQESCLAGGEMQAEAKSKW
jgi:hypothetical protein